MLLQFTEPFGHHKPGDLIEVPDGAAYDGSYLREAPEGADAESKAEKAQPARPLYKKKD